MSSFAEILAVERIGPDQFKSVNNPVRMGNIQPIAFGGYTIGIAVATAHYDIPDSHRLYAVHGNFLGPALIDRPVFCTVKIYRSTKTFTTKSVEVSQVQDDGSSRLCLVAIADFHVIESETFMSYSAPPTKVYSSIQDSWTPEERKKEMLDQGILTQKDLAFHAKTFGIMSTLVEMRFTTQGVGSQNLQGFAKGLETTQHSLPLTSRTSADWLRSREKLSTPSQHASALGFIMDALISFLPVTLQSLSLADVGACSTLEFSLRLFTPVLDVNGWHLREWRTFVGEAARTYSEAGLWDESGKMVASMTQSSILRPPKKDGAKPRL